MDYVCEKCGKPVMRFAGSVKKSRVCDDCLKKELSKNSPEELRLSITSLQEEVRHNLDTLVQVSNRLEKVVEELNKVRAEVRKIKKV